MLISRQMILNCTPCNAGFDRYNKALPWYEDWIRSNGRSIQQLSELIGNYIGEAYQHDKKTIRKSDFQWLITQVIKNCSRMDFEFIENQIRRIQSVIVFHDSYVSTPNWFDLVLAKANHAMSIKSTPHKVWHLAGVITELYYSLNRAGHYKHPKLKNSVAVLRGIAKDISDHHYKASKARMEAGCTSSYTELDKRVNVWDKDKMWMHVDC